MSVKHLSDEQIMNTSLEALGLLILKHIADNDEWNVRNLLIHLSGD